MGSRYGGLKQIDPVGPWGETVLDYAVFDAMRAGFGRVVFVIRKEFEAVFREQIGAKYAGRIEVAYVFQAVEALPEGFVAPAGREKPWGTGHAVWCAREAVPGAFAVINADDFYGADSFRRLGEFLKKKKEDGGGTAAPATECAIVGFRLNRTLSEHGAVSRGVCAVGADGRLASIVERTGIEPGQVGAGREFSGEEIVSMNCWGFGREVFAGLDAQLREFLEETGAGMRGERTAPPVVPSLSAQKAEFYLPAAVSTMIGRGEATVRVLPTESAWFGVTYREDKPRVVAAIAELVRRGEYPAKLF